MKKLKLNLSNLKGAEILTREQLKNVTGGVEEDGGRWCLTDSDCPPVNYQCAGSTDVHQSQGGRCSYNSFPPRCRYGFVCIGEVEPVPNPE